MSSWGLLRALVSLIRCCIVILEWIFTFYLTLRLVGKQISEGLASTWILYWLELLLHHLQPGLPYIDWSCLLKYLLGRTHWVSLWQAGWWLSDSLDCRLSHLSFFTQFKHRWSFTRSCSKVSTRGAVWGFLRFYRVFIYYILHARLGLVWFSLAGAETIYLVLLLSWAVHLSIFGSAVHLHHFLG